jgi:hypothetical protein
VHEDVVEELRAFVAGHRVLVEEAEHVDLAEGELDAVAWQVVEAAAAQAPLELAPSLGDDGIGLVRTGAGFEGHRVDGGGVAGPQRDAAALAEAQVAEAAQAGLAERGHRAQRQADLDVAAVVEPPLGLAGVAAAGAQPLADGDQPSFDLRPIVRLGRGGQHLDLCLERGQALAFAWLAPAAASGGGGHRRRGRRCRRRGLRGGGGGHASGEQPDLLFQLAVALLELLQPLHQRLQLGLHGSLVLPRCAWPGSQRRTAQAGSRQSRAERTQAEQGPAGHGGPTFDERLIHVDLSSVLIFNANASRSRL